MKQRDTLSGPRWDITTDSIQEWLDAVEAPVRFKEAVLSAIPKVKENDPPTGYTKKGGGRL